MDRIIARRVVLRGLVQGVGFRYWTRSVASRLGLDGWVRNRGDGSVEMVVRGDSERVGEMIDLCRRGPGGAHVSELSAFEEPPDSVQRGFDVRF
ncbi:acylphosphatase [Candidatus Fermentibacterales bacterium]|nr:acylphosphatase [Candidatus Fermentibacterales bacterium]